MPREQIDYVYFRCEMHGVDLACPNEAMLLRPIDPTDTTNGFEFDLGYFECAEAEDKMDPECVDTWEAQVDV